MLKRKGKIDGFWLLAIGIFVILPAIKYITGYEDKKESAGVETKTKVVSSENNVLIIDNNVLRINQNTSSAPINTEIKIPISKDVERIEITSPDSTDIKVIPIKGKYAITSFDETGVWNIDLCDINTGLIDWIKVTVE